MPILGIIASSITGNLATNSYESIATATVGSGGIVSVTFSSIPATYTHLQIRGFAQASTTNQQYNNVRLELNSDTTDANYRVHRLFTAGATITSNTEQFPLIGYMQDKSSSANTYSGFVIDVLDYANTNKQKTLRSLWGGDVNMAGGVEGLMSELWKNTAAITTIKLIATNGTSPLFTEYSQWALYGIKGA